MKSGGTKKSTIKHGGEYEIVKYCKHCGKQIEETVTVCPFCSGLVSAPYNSASTSSKAEKESKGVSTGLAILSALFPVVGIALGLIKLGNETYAAKKYLLISAISMSFYVFISLLSAICFY